MFTWRRTATNLSPTPWSQRRRCCGTNCLHSQNPTPTVRGWKDLNHVRGAASSAPPATARRRASMSSCTVGAGASATTPTTDSENWWKRAAQMQQQNCLWPLCQTGFVQHPPSPLASTHGPKNRLYVQWKLKILVKNYRKGNQGTLLSVKCIQIHQK